MARGMIAPVDDPVLGRIDVINAAAKFDDAHVGVRGPAPTLGQHNQAVLRDLLGYDEAAIAALTTSGVLRQEVM